MSLMMASSFRASPRPVLVAPCRTIAFLNWRYCCGLKYMRTQWGAGFWSSSRMMRFSSWALLFSASRTSLAAFFPVILSAMIWSLVHPIRSASDLVKVPVLSS